MIAVPSNINSMLNLWIYKLPPSHQDTDFLALVGVRRPEIDDDCDGKDFIGGARCRAGVPLENMKHFLCLRVREALAVDMHVC
jgi:hypothetical protein